MRASFLASDRTYGARRVWHDMIEDGISCGLHRIERLMRLQALRARPRRRRPPSDPGERQATAVAPNVLDWAFEAPAPNRKWIADFTYIWTAEGWLYVAAVVDLFSRRVVSWSMWEFVRDCLRSREQLKAQNTVIRHQLAALSMNYICIQPVIARPVGLCTFVVGAFDTGLFQRSYCYRHFAARLPGNDLGGRGEAMSFADGGVAHSRLQQVCRRPTIYFLLIGVAMMFAIGGNSVVAQTPYNSRNSLGGLLGTLAKVGAKASAQRGWQSLSPVMQECMERGLTLKSLSVDRMINQGRSSGLRSISVRGSFHQIAASLHVLQLQGAARLAK